MINEYNLARYCCGDVTEIENYSKAIADTTQTWEIHHRKGFKKDGSFAYSKEDLIKKGWYYNRPSEELIFLTPSEHSKLHNKGRSSATREKMSKSQKGNPYKHHDITVSQIDDRNAYMREYMRKYRLKKKALAANK